MKNSICQANLSTCKRPLQEIPLKVTHNLQLDSLAIQLHGSNFLKIAKKLQFR